jgi:ABC-type transport system involved in multi-copper enzyme maturation permease subunit
MKALIGVEVRRLLARRMFKVLSVFLILIFITIGVITFIASDDDPARVAAAAEKHQAEIAQCAAEDHSAQYCRDETYGSDPRFPYQDMQWVLGTLGFPMLMFSWLLGASFIGAEWANRTVMTTLTWNARRARVWAAKAAALGIVSFVWVVLIQGAFLAAMYPAGAFVGNMAGVDAGWWGETVQLAARIGGIATMAALFGLSLATLGRNTAAALGVGFVYLAVIEGMIRAFRPSWTDWLIGDNAGLIAIGDLDVNHLGHSMGAAGLLLTVYTIVLLGAALIVFRKRDVA